MLVHRKSQDDTAHSETAKKSAGAAERIFSVMSDIAHLTGAIDSAAIGDPSELDDIYESVANLDAYLREPSMRIKPVKDSGVLKLCHATLASLESNNINPEKIQDAWGKCYATFLTTYEAQQTSNDRPVYAATLAADTAAETNQIPQVAGPKGFVIARLPLLFTTYTSILSKLKRFPPDYCATQYAGGYLFQNQLLVGIDAEGKSAQAIGKLINAVIGAYRAKGTPMVNILGAGRKFPYFWHRGNSLAFVWLIPEEVYSKNPLHVNNVKINVAESKADITPGLTSEERQKKNRQDRELFEAFLNSDKTYLNLLEQVVIDKKLSDTRSAVQHQSQANKRKEALRLQWVEGKDADPLDAPENKTVNTTGEARKKVKYLSKAQIEAKAKTGVRVPVKAPPPAVRTPIASKSFGRLTTRSSGVKVKSKNRR